MGCPAKKVCNKWGGSALMQNEPLALQIVEAVVAACAPRNVPVTLKMRTGWAQSHKKRQLQAPGRPHPHLHAHPRALRRRQHPDPPGPRPAPRRVLRRGLADGQHPDQQQRPHHQQHPRRPERQERWLRPRSRPERRRRLAPAEQVLLGEKQRPLHRHFPGRRRIRRAGRHHHRHRRRRGHRVQRQPVHGSRLQHQGGRRRPDGQRPEAESRFQDRRRQDQCRGRSLHLGAAARPDLELQPVLAER